MYNKTIKKTVFTLNVDNYAPQITALTYPYMKRYADKIGAQFVIINKRKWPNLPPVYEKLQIYELAQEMDNDWNIFIDSDALVHPDMPDVTQMISKNTVMHNGVDFAPIRWNYDRYFMRDGRHIGSCNWFAVASDQCIDLWKPLDDITPEEAIKNIHPILDETLSQIIPDHLIDDYTLSRNIAKYGLKAVTFTKLLEENGNPGTFMWHQYQISIKEKVDNIKKVIEEWNKSPKQRAKEEEEKANGNK
jgi:hypothetical protein